MDASAMAQHAVCRVGCGHRCGDRRVQVQISGVPELPAESREGGPQVARVYLFAANIPTQKYTKSKVGLV